MKKYTLDQAGVDAWLTCVYGSTIQQQMAEQDLILLSFDEWLKTRFDLTETQIAYAAGLNPSFKLNLAEEIAFAINNHLPIVLHRASRPEAADATIRGNRDSVKVTEIKSKRTQSTSQQLADDGGGTWEEVTANGGLDAALSIRIYYVEEQPKA